MLRGLVTQSDRLRHLHGFLRRPLREQLMLLEAGAWLGFARLATRLVPLRRLAPFLGRYLAESSLEDEPAHRHTYRQTTRAILTMSRHFPSECQCLAQAIAAQMMLRRRYIPCTLYFGVRKSEEKPGVEAHAWLRCGSALFLADSVHGQFTVVGKFASWDQQSGYHRDRLEDNLER